MPSCLVLIKFPKSTSVSILHTSCLRTIKQKESLRSSHFSWPHYRIAAARNLSSKATFPGHESDHSPQYSLYSISTQTRRNVSPNSQLQWSAWSYSLTCSILPL